MKILEITEFSAGICGVWSRVFHESKELVKKGHEVFVFSSNLEKGTGRTVVEEEVKNNVKIFRFKNKSGIFDRIISKNVTHFDFEKKFAEINPDIVITHLIHPHSFKALKMCMKKNKPCILVTHAPFNVPRKFPLNFATWLYYNLKVKPLINQFNKVMTITRWEIPYLKSLGVAEDKIFYLPNAVSSEYFEQKINKFSGKKILFFGRIAPIKNIPLLISAFKSISGKFENIKLILVGPIERGYESIKNSVSENISFEKPVHETKNKIRCLQTADIFVLPSLREGLPISLIEAMALGKIVISSKTDGGKEVIEDGVDGLLFNIGNSSELSAKIEEVLNMKTSEISKMQNNARTKAREFESKRIIAQLNTIVESYK